MGTKTLPWKKLWSRLWASIQDPLTDGRLVVALDDFINVKTGKKIFGCSHIHDHAAKANQCDYPWAQCVVKLGLLKQIKGRWACIPLSALFFFRQIELDRGESFDVHVLSRLRSINILYALAPEPSVTARRRRRKTEIARLCA